jgi:Domain of unknown function DUF302
MISSVAADVHARPDNGCVVHPAGNRLLGCAAPCRRSPVADHLAEIWSHISCRTTVCRTDHRRTAASDRGSGLHGVQRHRSQRRSRTSWCADARLETRHVREAGCGAAVMLAAPPAALDIPLKMLVWEDRNGAVSVSYNSPGFLAGRHCRARSSVPPAPLAFHVATASRTRAGRRGEITRPSGRISPMSSNTITPLHSRLHPCSG